MNKAGKSHTQIVLLLGSTTQASALAALTQREVVSVTDRNALRKVTQIRPSSAILTTTYRGIASALVLKKKMMHAANLRVGFALPAAQGKRLVKEGVLKSDEVIPLPFTKKNVLSFLSPTSHWPKQYDNSIASDLFLRAVESTDDAVIITDKDGNILYVNGGFEKNSGYGRDEVLGKNPRILKSGYHEQAFYTGMWEKILSGSVFRNIQYNRRKDGSIIPVEHTISPVRDENGEITHFIGIWKDISGKIRSENETRQAQNQLKQNEIKYQIIADNTFDWEFWLDTDGSYIYSSPSCERITGYSPVSFTTDRDFLQRIVYAEDRAAFLAHQQDIQQRRLPGNLDFRIVCKDGTIKWIGHVCQPISDATGVFRGIRGSNRDITERKLAELALRQKESQAESLLRLARQLERVAGFDEAAQAALTEVQCLVGYQRLWVYVFSNDRSEAEVLAEAGMSRPFAPKRLDIKNDAMLSAVARGAGAVVIPDAAADVRTNKKIVQSTGVRTIVNIPVHLSEGRLASIGMGTYDDEGVRVPDESALQYLTTLASHMSATIDRLLSQMVRQTAEDSLRASEKRYRTLIDQAADGIFVATRDGQIEDVNPAGCRLMGYTVNELLKKPFYGLLDAEELIRQPLKIRQLEKGQSILSHRRLVRKDGTHVEVEISAKMLDDGRIQGIVRDISERRRVEKHFQALIERAPDGVVLINVEGKFQYISPSSARMFGYEMSELSDLDPAAMTHPDDVERVVQLILSVIENPDIDARAMYRFKHKDGSWKWIESTFTNLLQAPEVQAIVVNFKDVTERHNAEEALLHSEQKYRTLAETSQDMVLLFENNGYIIYANPAVEQNLGYAQGALAGKMISSILPSNADYDAISYLTGGTGHENGAASREMDFIHLNGEAIPFDVRTSKAVSSGTPVIVCIGRDNRSRRKYENHIREQLRYARALNRMATSIMNSDGTADTLLREMTTICGETIDIERALLFDIRMAAGEAVSIAKWIRPDFSDFAPPQEVYPSSVFASSISRLHSTRTCITSTVDAPHACFVEEGSAEILHRVMKVQSLLWYPFSFREDGFFLLVVNDMIRPRQWQEEELNFLDSVSREIELALLKHRLSSEREQAEVKLSETLREFETLVEAIPDAVLFKDGNGRWLIANPAVLKLFELTAYPWYGKTDRQLAEAFPALRSLYEGCIGTDELAWQTGQRYQTIEIIEKPGGDLLHYDTTKIPLLQENGTRLGLVVIGRDITFHKKANEIIQEQAMILDNARDAIFMTDPDGRIVYWNSQCETLYGWEKTNVIGHQATEVLGHTRATDAVVRSLFSGNEAWSGEIEHYTRDGRSVIVECRKSPVRDADSAVKSFLYIETDVTERKRLEKQYFRAQRMESIGRMASGIAHDLNNILSPILMAVQMFKSKLSDDTSQRLIVMLESNIERAADLMRKLLMFSRGAEGAHHAVDAKKTIEEIERILVSTFPKNIRIACNVAKGLYPITADSTQLHQVFLNLCVNARDAMPSGGDLTIHVENVIFDEAYVYKEHQAKPGPYVLFTVTDTGLGIPSDIIDHIFDPFFTTKDLEHGTGLGLSTVAAIIKGHGGFVSVYSEVGKGTQFKIYIPASAGFHTESVESRVPESLWGRGELILIVDDEPAIRKILGTILTHHGYQIVEAEDGGKAMTVFAAQMASIRAVITDISMPHMDGHAFIRMLRSIREDIPIIAMSGLPENEKSIQKNGFKVQAFLMKPYRAEKILQTLNDVLAPLRSGEPS